MPRKVLGEPHLEGSRITTVTLAALAARGYGIAHLADLYEVEQSVVSEALDVEQQLAGAVAA